MQSTVQMPGFTAEAALAPPGRGTARGGGGLGSPRANLVPDQWIVPADFVDQSCLAACLANCGSECAGTTGMAKSRCISACEAANDDCRAGCVRPGDPPPTGGTGGGGGGGLSLCAIEDSTHPGAFPLARWLRDSLREAGTVTTKAECLTIGGLTSSLLTAFFATTVPGLWKVVAALAVFNNTTIAVCVCNEVSW